MLTQAPKKEFILPYSIDKIKVAVNESLRLTKYIIYKKDDILNMYRFGTTRLLSTGIINIILTKVDETNTKCVFEIVNNPGSNTPVSVLDNMLSEYLDLFSNLVSGKTKIVNRPVTKKERNKARLYLLLGIILIILLFGIGYYFKTITPH